MADIARQTVEFLFEENGGIPSDMHLPTAEDIKEQMTKFTIDRIRKGDSVLILTGRVDRSGYHTCLSQMKTFGHVGEVLEVDKCYTRYVTG